MLKLEIRKVRKLWSCYITVDLKRVPQKTKFLYLNYVP
jgi:hypothetical protein